MSNEKITYYRKIFEKYLKIIQTREKLSKIKKKTQKKKFESINRKFLLKEFLNRVICSKKIFR